MAASKSSESFNAPSEEGALPRLTFLPFSEVRGMTSFSAAYASDCVPYAWAVVAMVSGVECFPEAGRGLKGSSGIVVKSSATSRPGPARALKGCRCTSGRVWVSSLLAWSGQVVLVRPRESEFGSRPPLARVAGGIACWLAHWCYRVNHRTGAAGQPPLSTRRAGKASRSGTEAVKFSCR